MQYNDYLQVQQRSWTQGNRAQHQLAVRTGFEPGAYGFQIWWASLQAFLNPIPAKRNTYKYMYINELSPKLFNH